MEFRGLKAQYKRYEDKIDSAIKSVLISADFISGNEVKKFEEKLSHYLGVKNCISCANGTDAMTLVLMAWNIGKGDAVFVPDFTFFATAEVVSLRGATPIFVDVDQVTFNMDPNSLEEKIRKVIFDGILTPRVVIPVDLFGMPANHYEISRISKKYNLKVLEDGAQGFGGKLEGQYACSFGDASTTSFFPAKPLGCYGDGGAIFTNDDDLANLIRSLAVHGKGQDKYDNIRVGLNSRLDTIQAAILCIKLDALISHEIKDVNYIAEIYNRELQDVVKVPYIPQNYESSFAQYTIRLKNVLQRDSLKKFLLHNDVPVMIYYNKPLRKQSAFKDLLDSTNSLMNSDILADTVLSLPIHPYLSDEEISKVIHTVKLFFRDFNQYE